MSKGCQCKILTFVASFSYSTGVASRRALDAARCPCVFPGRPRSCRMGPCGTQWRAGPSKVLRVYGDFVTTPLSLLHACMGRPDLLSCFVLECVNSHFIV